ncbi:serine hydrolase domain-containing protein [Actinospica robiniae]|uniref:serine hydrolase domain-containing protein n=1 Tax=Actinospica robiniae TaxID=304901 RepID=UPI00041B3FEC|nr:serine hydrolase domain-containing protein [Actinospica robiniae]
MVLTRVPRRRRSTALFAAAALAAAIVPSATASAAAAPRGGGDRGDCVASPTPTRGPGLKILDIAKTAERQYGLNSVILKVTEGRRNLLTAALGRSMTGIPADADMRFRTGSVGIAYMGMILLQLAQEGVVDLDDPISRWLPQVPHSQQITLRMLADSTSGLHDYVIDPVFAAELEAQPFKYWTEPELLAFPFSHTLWYTPGTNWSYSHANFVLLGEALAKITGRPLDELLRERILEPLHLDSTSIDSKPPIVHPVHAFTSERGTYEESTYWNPSWTTAHGAILTQDICDLATSAQAVGSGALLSPASHRIQLDPGTVGLGDAAACPPGICRHNTEAAHYGIGIQVINTWVVQNPSFSGYFAIQAYLPSQKLSIAVDTTDGPAATPNTNYAQTIATSIAAYLAPGHPLS